MKKLIRKIQRNWLTFAFLRLGNLCPRIVTTLMTPVFRLIRSTSRKGAKTPSLLFLKLDTISSTLRLSTSLIKKNLILFSYLSLNFVCLFFSSSAYCIWIVNQKMSISLIRKAFFLSRIKSLFNSEVNFLILNLISATKSGAYLDSWWNFKAYSFTDTLPYLRFTNSSILAFLSSWGKNWSKKILEKAFHNPFSSISPLSLNKSLYYW